MLAEFLLNCRKVPGVWRREGFRGVLARSYKIASTQFSNHPFDNALIQLRAIYQYEEAALQPDVDRPPNPRQLRLAWIVPDFRPGAGGHTTIFRMIHYLEQFGHLNEIWVQDPCFHASEAHLRADIQNHFFPLNAEVHLLQSPREAHAICGDGVIATDRWTAYPARAVSRVRRRFYFVQDFEPWFFPMGSLYLAAEQTYRFGFCCITAGQWLADVMRSRFGAEAYSFPLAVDAGAYYADRNVSRAAHQVALYARSETDRRAVELAVLGLEIAARELPDLTVECFGSERKIRGAGVRMRHRGVLTTRELGNLYRTASAGMVFSATNYSLIPNEMMACGCPVIELGSPSTSLEYPGDAVTLVEADPRCIAAAIVAMLKSPARRLQQTKAGSEFVKRLSWEHSARCIEAALQMGLGVHADACTAAGDMAS